MDGYRVVTASVYLLAEDSSGVAVAVIRRDSDHKTRFTERAPGWERAIGCTSRRARLNISRRIEKSKREGERERERVK